MKNKTICTILVVSIAFAIVVSGVALGANTRASDSTVSISSSTIHVPGDYLTIREAVAHALPGDTIIVHDGTYPEDIIDVNKERLAIKSASGSKNCIIEAKNNSVFEVTADYVNIRGFTVKGPASEGIYLMNADYCDILDNVVSDASKGICLNSSSHNNITNNIASDNHHGIWLTSSSNNNKLLNNNASSNDNQGITIESSSNNQIRDNNTVSNNWIGIVLEGSSNNTVVGNNVSGNKHHNLRVSNSNSNNVTNNIASNSGLGIYLRYSSINNITDNTCLNNGWKGIRLLYSSNNRLISNNVSNGWMEGIYLDSYSSNNRLISNDAFNNHNHGIFLDFSSSNNRIINNTVDTNHFQGIHLESSSNNITENKVSNNPWGIVLYSSNSKKNRLSNNTVWNSTRGICIGYSSNNTLIKNTVSDNTDFGIYLESSSNNTIYNNYFNNTNNSYDNGNNTWNITKTAGSNIVGGPYLGGNYWSDYNGTDLDGDKLGDTLLQYNCSGRIQFGGDYHPLIIIPKIILKASKDGYASVKQEIDNDENFEQIEISGNVTDKSTGEPIEGAKVEIVKGADPASTTTDAKGTYTVTVIIPEGSGSDTREDVNFELPPAEYIVGVYEITSEVAKLIEDNNGTIIDQMDHGEGHRAYLVEISKEENIDSFINSVKTSPLVEYVEFNYLAEPEYVPNDSYYGYQWGPQRIRAGGLPNPSAWDVEKGNKSVRIAIIDTGIDYTHEDLTGNYVAYGYDWSHKDSDPMDQWDWYWVRNWGWVLRRGHGTHVAGIAAAVMDNNRGIAGIAQVEIMAEKVLPGSVWTVSKGIYDAVLHDADIISMSLSYGWNPHPLVENACEYAWLSDCILVAASGNQYGGMIRPWYFTSPRIRYPAANPHVIAVGNTQSDNSKHPSSNWGSGLELVAPGTNIYSTLPDNDYDYKTGTSMAAPHVSGVAALLKSHAKQFPPEPLATDPWYHLNNKQIRTIMQRTAEDLGPVGRDQIFGYGLVDAESALRYVNISGNVLESVFNAPIPHPPGAPFPPEVRVTSIEGAEGIYTTNENTTIARITKDGDYFVRVPQGVYSICAMAYGYIPSRGLGGERIELPAFDFLGQLNTEYREFRLVPFPCNVTGNVTDNETGLPITDAFVSLDGPPHIYPPHPDVHMETETKSNGNYSFIMEYGVHPPYPTGEAVYNITVRKSGYQTQTRNFTLNWSDVVKDYYKCPLDPKDYDPPIVNFSLLSGPSELPDLTLTSEDILFIPPASNSTSSSSSKHTKLTKDIYKVKMAAEAIDVGSKERTYQVMDASNTINSSWTASPPIIDGTLESGEWVDGHQNKHNLSYWR